MCFAQMCIFPPGGLDLARCVFMYVVHGPLFCPLNLLKSRPKGPNIDSRSNQLIFGLISGGKNTPIGEAQLCIGILSTKQSHFCPRDPTCRKSRQQACLCPKSFPDIFEVGHSSGFTGRSCTFEPNWAKNVQFSKCSNHSNQTNYMMFAHDKKFPYFFGVGRSSGFPVK